MLASLEIRNYLLIKKLKIDFNKGFNTFTGETGAGKSIIIDGLKLALGGRNLKDLNSQLLIKRLMIDLKKNIGII